MQELSRTCPAIAGSELRSIIDSYEMLLSIFILLKYHGFLYLSIKFFSFFNNISYLIFL